MKPLHLRQLEHVHSTCGINQASQIRATYLPGSQKHEVPLLEFIWANRFYVYMVLGLGLIVGIASAVYLLEGGKL